MRQRSKRYRRAHHHVAGNIGSSESKEMARYARKVASALARPNNNRKWRAL